MLRTSSWSSRSPRSTWRSLLSYVAEPNYDGLASTLGRLNRLKVLSIHPFDRHPLPSTLRSLDLVPSLHRFYMCQNDLDAALVRPHLNLTILKIDIDIPLDEELLYEVRRKVESICRIKTDRPDWLPSLRFVATDCFFESVDLDALA